MNVSGFQTGRARPLNDTASTVGFQTMPSILRVPVLKQYWSILRRRKWIVLASVIVALLIGLIVTLLMTPLYTATNTIEIQRETRNFAQVEGAQNDETAAVDQEFYQTQYGLLESASLAQEVANDLRLYDDAVFFEMFAPAVVDEWFENGRIVQSAPSRDERTRIAADLLLTEIEVEPQRLSRLVDISMTSPDPQFSTRVVNVWAQKFISSTLERRFEATSYARDFLEERLGQLRERLDQSERELVAYAAEQGIVNLPAEAPGSGDGSAERSLVADDLAALNRELAQATADRVSAQSRLGVSGGSVREGLDNAAITTMRAQRSELASQYAEMMVRFEPQYPPAVALRTQIEELDRSISREETRVGQTLRTSYTAAQRREDALEERVSQLKAGLLDQRRKGIQYNIYQREVDTNRELYDALLQRYKEIGVAGGIGVNNILVVDEAEVPQAPSSPILWLNIILSLFAGGLIGVGLAFALEQIDEGIGDPSEVEEKLGVPLLGTVPRTIEDDPMIEMDDRKSSLSEAYLSLQTRLAFSTDHGIPQIVGFTSTGPAEGKTTSSLALARSIARGQGRVLLIDSDMRSPSIHHRLGVTNEAGLSNFLAGENDLTSLIHASGLETGLRFMTAGPQPPNAAELLTSKRLATLFDRLRDDFDQIIVDAPPVMGLADAPLIGSAVEGMVFVIESHRTRKARANVAISRLNNSKTHLLGVLMTKFDTRRAHYGYGYDYGYGYGYGENEASEESAKT